MFHGPIKEAVPFFESLGFRCPKRKDHASFLQEVTTPKGRLPDSSKLSLGCLRLTRNVLISQAWGPRGSGCTCPACQAMYWIAEQ